MLSKKCSENPYNSGSTRGNAVPGNMYQQKAHVVSRSKNGCSLVGGLHYACHLIGYALTTNTLTKKENCSWRQNQKKPCRAIRFYLINNTLSPNVSENFRLRHPTLEKV